MRDGSMARGAVFEIYLTIQILLLGHLCAPNHPLDLLVVCWVRLCFVNSYNRVRLSLYNPVIRLLSPIAATLALTSFH